MKTSQKISNCVIRPSHTKQRTFQLTVAGHCCPALLLLLQEHMVAHQNHINHADSKLALQKLPLETIPQGSQGADWLRAQGEKIEINE